MLLIVPDVPTDCTGHEASELYISVPSRPDIQGVGQIWSSFQHMLNMTRSRSESGPKYLAVYVKFSQAHLGRVA